MIKPFFFFSLKTPNHLHQSFHTIFGYEFNSIKYWECGRDCQQPKSICRFSKPTQKVILPLCHLFEIFVRLICQIWTLDLSLKIFFFSIQYIKLLDVQKISWYDGRFKSCYHYQFTSLVFFFTPSLEPFVMRKWCQITIRCQMFWPMKLDGLSKVCLFLLQLWTPIILVLDCLNDT